jgi:hypothetical protein
MIWRIADMRLTPFEHVLINKAHELIKSKGYISASELVMRLVEFWYTDILKKDECVEYDLDKLVPLIDKHIADGKIFHKVEYCNESTEEFRIKDLFYYNPTVSRLNSVMK